MRLMQCWPIFVLRVGADRIDAVAKRVQEDHGSKMNNESVGTDAEGFDVSTSGAGQTVHVRTWGFWGEDVAARFSGVVVGACASARAPVVTIDARDLKPLREAGQDAFGAMLAALPVYRVQRVVVTTAAALIKLQLLRIAKEHSIGNLVQFVS